MKNNKVKIFLIGISAIICLFVSATDLSVSTKPKIVAGWPQTNDDSLDLMSRIAANTAKVATNTITLNGNVSISPTSGVTVLNAPLYDQNVTNIQPSLYKITITNAASGSFTWGAAGVTNIVVIPSRLTNVGVQLIGVYYNRHTNTAFNACWLITTNPIFWNTVGLQAYVTNSDRDYIIGKIVIDTDTNHITGFYKSVYTNCLLNLPAGTNYFYMKYKCTTSNAGGTPTDSMVLHFNNN
jgi:hypothetical protein